MTLPDLLNPSPPPAEEGAVLAGSLLPFELRLTLDVALTRAALDPNQAASSFVKDNQRLFLTQVFPRAPDPAGYDAHGRTTTLPYAQTLIRSLLRSSLTACGLISTASSTLLSAPLPISLWVSTQRVFSHTALSLSSCRSNGALSRGSFNARGWLSPPTRAV